MAIHPPDNRIRPPRYKGKQRGGAYRTSIRQQARDQAKAKAARAMTQKVKRTQELQATLEKKIEDRFKSAELDMAILSKSKEATSRDLALQSRELAQREELRQQGLIQKERENAADVFIQQTLEVPLQDNSLMATKELGIDPNLLEARVATVQSELRTEAIARDTQYQQTQVNLLRNYSRSQRAAMLLRKQQEIAAAYDLLIQTRTLAALNQIKESMRTIQRQAQQQSIFPSKALPVLRQQLPMVRASIDSLTVNINFVTNLISRAAFQALYEIQILIGARTSVDVAISSVVGNLRSIITQYNFLLQTLRGGNAAIPGLNSLRDSLLGSLNTLRPAISQLEGSIVSMNDPNGIQAGRALFMALTSQKSEIDGQIRYFQEQITIQGSRLSNAQIAAAAATLAREAAITNSGIAYAAAQGLAAQSIRDFEAAYATSKEKAEGLATTTGRYKQTRDGFITEADTNLRAFNQAKELYQNPLEAELKQFTDSTFTPAQTAYTRATESLSDSQGRIIAVEGIASGLRGLLPGLRSKVSGGFPQMPQALIDITAQISGIFTTLNTTFPQRIGDLTTQTDLLKWSADSLYTLIAPQTGLYWIAESRSKPPSDVAMTAWQTATQYYANYINTIKSIQLALASNQLLVEQYVNQTRKPRQQVLSTLFQVQYNVLDAERLSAAAGTSSSLADTTRDSVLRAGGLNSITFTAAGNLATLTPQFNRTSDLVDAADLEIGRAVIAQSDYDFVQEYMLVVWYRYVVETTFLNPQLTVVRGLGTTVRVNTSDLLNIGGSVSRFFELQRSASILLDSSKTSLQIDSGSRTRVDTARTIKRFQRSQLVDMLNIRTNRTSAYILFTTSKQTYKEAYSQYDQARFPRSEPPRTDLNTTVSQILDSSSSLDTKTTQLQRGDSTLSTIDIPIDSSREDRIAALNQLGDMFIMTPTLGYAYYFNGLIASLDTPFSTADTNLKTQQNVVKNIVKIQQTQSNVNAIFGLRETFFEKRNDAWIPYNSRSTDIQLFGESRDTLSDRSTRMEDRRNMLYSLRDTMKNKEYYRGLYTQSRGVCSALFEGYRQDRLRANQNRPIVYSSDFMLTLNEFQTRDSIVDKLGQMDRLPIPIDESSPIVQSLRSDIERYQLRQREIVSISLVSLQTFQIGQSKTAMETADDILGAFNRNYLQPQIQLIVKFAGLPAQLIPIDSLRSQLFQSRKTALDLLLPAVAKVSFLRFFAQGRSVMSDFLGLEQRKGPVLQTFRDTSVQYQQVYNGLGTTRPALQSRPEPSRPSETTPILNAVSEISSKREQTTTIDTISVPSAENEASKAVGPLADSLYEKALLTSGTDPAKLAAAAMDREISKITPSHSAASGNLNTQKGIVEGLGTKSSQQLPVMDLLKQALDIAFKLLKSAKDPRDSASGTRDALQTEKDFYEQLKVSLNELLKLEGYQGTQISIFKTSSNTFKLKFQQFDTTRQEAQSRPAPTPVSETSAILDTIDSIDMNNKQILKIENEYSPSLNAEIKLAQRKLSEAIFQIKLYNAGTDGNLLGMAQMEYELSQLPSIDELSGLIETQRGTVDGLGTTSSQQTPDLNGPRTAMETAKAPLDISVDSRDAVNRAKTALQKEQTALTSLKDGTLIPLRDTETTQEATYGDLLSARSAFESAFNDANTARVEASNPAESVRPDTVETLDVLTSLTSKAEDLTRIEQQLSSVETELETARTNQLGARREEGYLVAGTNPIAIELVNLDSQIQELSPKVNAAQGKYTTQQGIVEDIGKDSSQQQLDLNGARIAMETAKADLDGAILSRDTADGTRGTVSQEYATLTSLRADVLVPLRETQLLQEDAYGDALASRATYEAAFNAANLERIEASKPLQSVSLDPANILDTLQTLNENLSQLDTINTNNLPAIQAKIQETYDSLLKYLFEKAILKAGTDPNQIGAAFMEYQIRLLLPIYKDASDALDIQLGVVRDLGLASSQELPDLGPLLRALQTAAESLKTAVDPRDQATKDKVFYEERRKRLEDARRIASDLLKTEVSKSDQLSIFATTRDYYKDMFESLGQLTFDTTESANLDPSLVSGILNTLTTFLTKLDEQATLEGVDINDIGNLITLYGNLADVSNLNLLYSIILELLRQLETQQGILTTQSGVVDGIGTNISEMIGDLLNLLNALRDKFNRRKDAKDKIDEANQNILDDTATRDNLFILKSKLNTLRDVLRSFFEIVRARREARNDYQGRAGYYKTLLTEYETNRVNAEGLKIDAMIDLANTTPTTRVDTSVLLSNAIDLADKLGQMNKLESELSTLNTKMEGLQKDLEFYILQKHNVDIREILKKIFEIQREMNTLQERIQEILNILNELKKTTPTQQDSKDTQSLRDSLKLQMERIEGQIRALQDSIRAMKSKLQELIIEINTLLNLRRMLKNKLPVPLIVPFGGLGAFLAGSALLGGLLFLTPITTPVPRPVGSSPDCAAAKTRGYREGYEAGSRDGYARGYADAKRDFDMYSRRFLASSLQQAAQASTEPQPQQQPLLEDEQDDGVQYGGEAEDDYEDPQEQKEEPQEEDPGQLMALPTGYTPIPPLSAPVPSDSEIRVPPQLSITPDLQECYRQGYLAGYKLGFSDTYLRGFRAFVPSQLGFVPPLQEQPEKAEKVEEKPDEFGYAPPEVGEEVVVPELEEEVARPVVPSDITMDEAYRNRYNQIQMSQFV